MGPRRVAEAPSSEPGAGTTGAWSWLDGSRQGFQSLMQMLASGRLQEPRSPVEDRGAGVAKSDVAGPGASSVKPEASPSSASGAGKVAQGASQSDTASDTAKTEAKTDKKAPAASSPGSAPNDAKAPLTRDSRPGAAVKATREPGPPAARKGGSSVATPKPESPSAPASAPSSPAAEAQGKAPSKAPATAGAAQSPPSAAPAPRRKTASASPDRRRTGASQRACRAAGRGIRVPGWYVVRRGDSLSAIARRHYGSARFYTRIRAANRGRIGDPNRIATCQRLYLPRLSRR